MNLLLGISGGIAAYKVPELIRLFRKQGHSIKVIATENALQFVTPLTLETLSQNKIYADVFAPINEYSTEHVSMSNWADCMVVAPATANIIGKFANGIADDALSTTFMAFDKPIFIAPAMNVRMYKHPILQENLQKLQTLGIQFIGPAEGELACGVTGKGRMEEPTEIVRLVKDAFTEKFLVGKKIIITAGPTYEKIDPVRFIGNYSSGKMGFALAEACAQHGALVTLIAGPVQLKAIHQNITRIDVESADEMYQITTQYFPQQDGAILCAAVADFCPDTQANSKIKREKDNLVLNLKPTHDIAAALGQIKIDKQFLIGFALETDHENVNAQEKMKRKNFDFIVLNSLQNKNTCFGYDTNQVTIFHKNGSSNSFEMKDKKSVAEDIVNELRAI